MKFERRIKERLRTTLRSDAHAVLKVGLYSPNGLEGERKNHVYTRRGIRARGVGGGQEESKGLVVKRPRVQ